MLSIYLASCGGSSSTNGASVTPGSTTNSDPANVATNTSSGGVTVATPAFGLDGFSQCGGEGSDITLAVKTHLAYGANGAFVYLFNQIGKLKLDNVTFGSDPIFGVSKAVYCKVVVDGADVPLFAASLAKMKGHLTGEVPLTPAQINEQASTLAMTMYAVVDNPASLADALDIIDLYEKKEGVFFVGAKTKPGFNNQPGSLDGFELARAVFTLQQGVKDRAFSAETFKKYRTLLTGRKFNTADFFPGKVQALAIPTETYNAKINASMPKITSKPTAFSNGYALRPTGYYLAPGDVATVTVPAALVDNGGFSIQVGAHKQDKNGSNPVRRFFRVSSNFPIKTTTTEIVNPFGGGIYIITPYLADAGVVSIQIKNAVPAPFFSATAHNKTTLADWLATQRNNPAPWADFESDKFMMQVPSGFITTYAEPVKLMADWDLRMDAVSKLIGQPLVRNNNILYILTDTDIMFSGHGIGYPAINTTFDPNKATNGNEKVWYLTPGSGIWETEFHELGHAQLFSNFPGEGEAAVNVLAAAVRAKTYSFDIDEAFGRSFSDQPQISREQAALNWMVTPNFRAGKPMDISNTTKDEVRYQHRGWAKYIEVAALFGWSALEEFYEQENKDYITPVASDGLSAVDSRIFRMSKKAKADLTPLIHFWGVQPDDSGKLSKAIADAGLKPSLAIYNRLVKYQSIIPMNNAQFSAHALVFLKKTSAASITAGQSPDYGEGWYRYWLPQYNETHGLEAQAAMTTIINRYFPSGKPL